VNNILSGASKSADLIGIEIGGIEPFVDQLRVIFPFATATTTYRSRFMISSGLEIFLAISTAPFVQFLSLIYWYKFAWLSSLWVDILCSKRSITREVNMLVDY
jgi:hypothetical protein